MSTEIIYLGHSSFQVLTNNKSILIDPFFTDNPTATTTADELDADVILVTHGHFDHVADVETIAKRTGALLIANYEIVTWFQNQGITNTHAMHIGGQHAFDFGIVKFTIAHHGSCLPDGSNGGQPTGILLTTVDGTIYHAGDTGLFLDMQLIAEEDIQVAILPIGDNFTMGPADSVKATGFLKASTVIPAHFNTWPLIEQDTDSWQESIRSETTAQPVVLSPGEAFLLQKS